MASEKIYFSTPKNQKPLDTQKSRTAKNLSPKFIENNDDNKKTYGSAGIVNDNVNSRLECKLDCSSNHIFNKKNRYRTTHVRFLDDNLTRNNFRSHHVQNSYSVDKSRMGYDWIAGMVENEENIADLADDFFKDIAKFRNENYLDCKTFGPSINLPTRVEKMEDMKMERTYHKHDSSPKLAYYCGGGGSYMVDKRFDIVPIHGPYSECPVCKRNTTTISRKADIRVSVPSKSFIPSNRVQLHRRKSFDSSNSVALSSHCLAGWEKTKSTSKRSGKSIDLKSHFGTNNRTRYLR